MSELPDDETPWTWERRVSSATGKAEYYGKHPYRSATVTNPGTGWQARVPTVSTGDQYSPYFKTPLSAKRWAERYGRALSRLRRYP
jgi:hypothetical protein